MADPDTSARRNLPSVDAVMRGEAAQAAAARFGRQAVAQAVRGELAALRRHGLGTDADGAAALARARLEAEDAPLLRPVYNLTGTMLHTNLGRAPIAETAIEAAATAMRNAVALEYDLASGRRGDRDEHVCAACCANSPARRTPPSSTTMPPRCCWCSTRSPTAATPSCRAAS